MTATLLLQRLVRIFFAGDRAAGFQMRPFLACLLALFGVGAARAQPTQQQFDALRRIEHIVVVFMENRSFDNLFATFPGANGIANAGPAALQVQASGAIYPILPQPLIRHQGKVEADTRFPASLPNGPFRMEDFAKQTDMAPSPIHAFYQEQAQIAGGAMNRFVAYTDVGAAVMGWQDMRESTHWKLAAEFTLGDNFFHSAFGGSFLNHAFLACSCAFRWPGAPDSIVARLDTAGQLVRDGQVTPDGYAVNTSRSIHLHHPNDAKDPERLVPAQTMPHLGNRLDAAGVSWKWYSQGYDNALAGKPDRAFSFHHNPFAYFADLAPGSEAQKRHLQDYPDLERDLANNTLPQIVFYKPLASNSMHPGNGTVAAGDAHLAEVIAMLRASPAYANMLIIVTYDENGGYWDHVAPPKRDRWGPGSRVPMIAIGNMVRRGFIDHTQYDFGSILRTIQLRWRVAPVNDIDARATPLWNLLQ